MRPSLLDWFPANSRDQSRRTLDAAHFRQRVSAMSGEVAKAGPGFASLRQAVAR
jgi:hypothetical protein